MVNDEYVYIIPSFAVKAASLAPWEKYKPNETEKIQLTKKIFQRVIVVRKILYYMLVLLLL